MKIEKLGNDQKLGLKNDGTLEIFFIGVGSAFAMNHNQTNLLLIKGDTHIMVDFGMTGPKALKETARLDVTDLEVFLPTHSHADHVGGFECAGLLNRYKGQPFLRRPKLRCIITPPYQEMLWDMSLRGGMEWNEQEHDSQKTLSFPDFFVPVRPTWMELQPREIYEIDFEGIHLEMFRTKHIPSMASSWQRSFFSIGLFVDRRIFISMDTRFDPDLIDMYADRSEVMFHDVQFFPDTVHAPLADLKTLPEDIKRKMHLMHYADDFETQDITGFAGWTQQGVRYIFD